MKISGVKAMFGKVMAIGLFAGAVALVGSAKAEAQQVAFGVQFGSPYYQGYYEGDARRDFWQHEQRERAREAAIAQHEAWERHQAYEQHERWEHARDYDRDRDRGAYGYRGR